METEHDPEIYSRGPQACHYGYKSPPPPAASSLSSALKVTDGAGDVGSWPAKFTKRKYVDSESLKRPLIDELRASWNQADTNEIEEEESDEDDSDGDEDFEGLPLQEEHTSIASVFMRGQLHVGSSQVSETYHRQAEEVESFCGDITFQDLQEENWTVEQSAPLALLEENSHDDVCRKTRGLMSSGQLYHVLQNKVCQFHLCIEVDSV